MTLTKNGKVRIKRREGDDEYTREFNWRHAGLVGRVACVEGDFVGIKGSASHVITWMHYTDIEVLKDDRPWWKLW